MPDRVLDEPTGTVVFGDKHDKGIYEEQTRRATDAPEVERPATEEVGGRPFDRARPTKAPAYGVVAIARAVEGFQYPVGRDAVLRCAGDNTLEFRRGATTTVHAALARVDAESFASQAELVDAIERGLDERSGADRRAK